MENPLIETLCALRRQRVRREILSVVVAHESLCRWPVQSRPHIGYRRRPPRNSHRLHGVRSPRRDLTLLRKGCAPTRYREAVLTLSKQGVALGYSQNHLAAAGGSAALEIPARGRRNHPRPPAQH